METQKNSVLIILSIVAAIVASVAVAAYIWIFIVVNDISARAEVISEEVELLTVKNDHTQMVRRVVRDTQKERTELNGYFVTEEEIVTFLEDIEGLGYYSDADIVVQTVETGKPVDKDGLVIPLRITLKAEGRFREVFHTLMLIEALPKVLMVEGARITENNTKQIWEGFFDITTMQIVLPENS